MTRTKRVDAESNGYAHGRGLRSHCGSGAEGDDQNCLGKQRTNHKQ